MRSLGPHFQRPGRTILERYLVDVPEPPAGSGLQALARTYFCGTADAPPFLPQQADVLPVLMQKEMRWRDLLAAGVRKMQASGDVDREADPERIAMVILTAVQGGLVMSQPLRSAWPLEAALDSALDPLHRVRV